MKLKSHLNHIACLALLYPTVSMAAPNPASQDWVQAYIANFGYVSVATSYQSCVVGTNCPNPYPFDPYLTGIVYFQNTTAASPALSSPTYDATTGMFTINASGTYRITYNINAALCDATAGDTVQYSADLIISPLPSALAYLPGVSANIIAAAQTNSVGYSMIGGTSNAGSEITAYMSQGTTIYLSYAIDFYTVADPTTDNFFIDPAPSDCGYGSYGTMLSIFKVG